MSLDDYEHSSIYTSPLIGRDDELNWLHSKFSDFGTSNLPVYIQGNVGIGKTALVDYFVSNKINNPNIYKIEGHKSYWVSLESSSNQKETISNFLSELYAQIPKQRFYVVFDGIDMLSDEEIERITNRIYNIKRTKGLIFIGQKDRKFNRSDKLNLDLSTNFLYEFTNGIALPKSEIVEHIRPQIISATEYMIQELKKEPESIHKLSPRAFEELLAELLTSLGWEVDLTKPTRDGGKDILAYMKTDIGNLLCLVEAKRYRKDRKIGVDLVRQLYGTLCDHKATTAMLATTSSFTSGAREFQQKYEYKLSLREYDDIVSWIQNYKFKNK